MAGIRTADAVGRRVRKVYKGDEYVAEIDSEGGKPFVVIVGPKGHAQEGRTYPSLSAACSGITGRPLKQSGSFWDYAEGAAPVAAAAAPTKVADNGEAPVTDALLAGAGKARVAERPKRERKYSLIRRVTQAGVAEGMQRIFCDACMKAHIVEAGELPAECPAGHRTDDPELTRPAEA